VKHEIAITMMSDDYVFSFSNDNYTSIKGAGRERRRPQLQFPA